MTDSSSRYAGHPSYRRQIPGGEREVELYEPRFRREPPAVRRHVVEATDRLDILAYRYLEDPHRFWRIADANPEVGLEELLEPGRPIKIPRPPQ